MTVSVAHEAITAPDWAGWRIAWRRWMDDLSLDSPPGGGTRVCALLPVSDEG